MPAAAELLLLGRVLTLPSTARRSALMVTVETARREKSRRMRDKENIPLETVGFIVLWRSSQAAFKKKIKITNSSLSAIRVLLQDGGFLAYKNLLYEKFLLQSDERVPSWFRYEGFPWSSAAVS